MNEALFGQAKYHLGNVISDSGVHRWTVSDAFISLNKTETQ